MTPPPGCRRRPAQRDLRQPDHDLDRRRHRHADRHPGRHLSGRIRPAMPRSRTVVRFINDILLSAPSIVIGLFVYEIVVVPMGHFSGLGRRRGAGRSSSFRWSCAPPRTCCTWCPTACARPRPRSALPHWKVIAMVAYRAARAGMITGVLLAIARISGETAPLLFTALNNQFWSTDLNAPMASLPVVIFQFALSPYADWQQLAWAGALVITITVLRSASSRARSSASRRSDHECRHDRPARPRAAGPVAPVGRQPRTARCADKGRRSATCIFYYGRRTGAEGHQPAALRQARSPPSSARRAAASPPCCASSTASTTSIRSSAPTGEVLLDGENILDAGQDLNLLRARIGMVFQKPTPFPMSIYENIAFGIRLYEKLSRAGHRRARRAGAAPRGAVGRGQGQAQAKRPQPFGRPAAAPVHRPRRRGEARGAAARRALLGARSDLHRQDRGADRRAEGRLHASPSSPTTCSRRRASPTSPPSCIWAS